MNNTGGSRIFSVTNDSRVPLDLDGVLRLSVMRLTPVSPDQGEHHLYHSKQGVFRPEPVISPAEVGGDNRPVALVVDLDSDVPEIAKGKGLKELEQVIDGWFPGLIDKDGKNGQGYGVMKDESDTPRAWVGSLRLDVLETRLPGLIENKGALGFGASSHSPKITDPQAGKTNAGQVIDDLGGAERTRLIGVGTLREQLDTPDALDYPGLGAETGKEFSVFRAIILGEGTYPGRALSERIQVPGLGALEPHFMEAESHVSTWLDGRSFADAIADRAPTAPSKRMPQTLITGVKETLAVTPLPNLEVMSALHEAAYARNQQFMEARKKAGKEEAPEFKRITESPFLPAITKPQNLSARKELPRVKVLHHGAPSSHPAMLRLHQQIQDPSALAANGLRRWLYKNPDRRKKVANLGKKVIEESGQISSRKNPFFLMLMWPLRDTYKRFLEEVSSREQEGLVSSRDIAWTHYDLADAWVRACEFKFAQAWGINELEGIVDQTLLTALDGTPHASRTNLRTQFRGALMDGFGPTQEYFEQPIAQFPNEYPESMANRQGRTGDTEAGPIKEDV